MGQGDLRRAAIVSAVLALSFSLSCRVEEPLLPTGGTGSDSSSGGTGGLGANPGSGTGGSSSSQAITPPIIADPLSGSSISDNQPTLTVLNSARSGGAPPTYLFQVSTESTFSSLKAQSTQVPEGAGGSTAWDVDRVLDPGRYFWRVRARSGTQESDFSATADFTLGSSSGGGNPPPPPNAPPPPSSGAILNDPLAGGSIGEVSGGRFTSEGWQVTSSADYIRYEVPTISSGWVEFETTGLRIENPSPDQFMLFGMWDPSAGDYRQNRFRVHLQKLHPNPHNPPYLRVRWISNGEQHDEGANFHNWNPTRSYGWRIEWGPSGSGNQARVLLEGQQMIVVNYGRTYSPSVHLIELGIAERGESIVGVTYSNFRVGR